MPIRSSSSHGIRNAPRRASRASAPGAPDRETGGTALAFAATFAVGAWLHPPFPVPSARIALPFGAATLLAAAFTLLWLGNRRLGLATVPLAVVLGAAAAAGAWAEPDLARLRDSSRGLEGPWRTRGQVTRAPRPTRGGASFRVRVDALEHQGRWRTTDGVVEVGLPDMPRRLLPAGSRIEVFLRLRADRSPANPGLPRRDRLGVRGVDLRARLKSDLQIRRRAPGPSLQSRLARLRRTIRSRLEARLDRAGEAIALALGERGGIDDASMIRLARSGLVHLFAISGLHVGLVALGAVGMLRAAGASPRGAALAGAGSALALAALVTPAAPVRRAALMALAIGVGPALGRRHSPRSALALALVVLVALEPRAVHSPGFQMSALATTGLLLSLGPRARAGPRDTLRASLVAQAWVAPVIAASGAAVPIAAPLLNVVALPLLTAALAAIAASLLVGEVALAGPLSGGAADLALAGLERLSRFGAATPAAIARFSVVSASLWYGALVLLHHSDHRRRSVAAVTLLVLAWFTTRAQPPPEHPRLDVLDVGQGDALRLHTAPGELVIDAGGYPGLDYDVGAHLVLPALRRLGVRSLDVVALSHAHADHAAGLPSVAAQLGPAELWAGVTPIGEPRMDRIRTASGDDTALLLPRGPARPIGDCRLRPLLPSERLRRAGLREVDNEASLALVAACGPVDVWLTGDAGVPAERGWSVAAGRRTLLKVGHHGSASATSDAFLDRLRPRHAVISVGARNAFGLPRQEVLERLRRRGIALYRTDRDGALSFELGGRVRVRGERWSAGG